MIVVIADDFSGAAEIGGLGLDYGLKTRISTELPSSDDLELFIIATDTRSMEEKQAYRKIKTLSDQLTQMNYLWIYKKTDSVMRGHILQELLAMLQSFKTDRALLVPSNPSLGRIISNGKYYVQNTLLEDTAFSKDPEFSSRTSDIMALLGKSPLIRTCILKKGTEIPHKCISVGEAKEESDLIYWANKVTGDIIPAGAAAFFESLLQSKGFCRQTEEDSNTLKLGKRALYVLGSSYSNTGEAISDARKYGCFVSEMPDDLFHATSGRRHLLENWINELFDAYRYHSKVVIAINKPIIHKPEHARRLRKDFAIVVEKIFSRISLDELFIEGGATSFSIINVLKLEGFIPVRKLAPGVIRMRIENSPDLHLTIKPGSYSWPKEIWQCDY